MTPPMKPINTASVRYSRSTWPVCAPTAFLRPISRKRSVTAMIIVFTTDSPPITSASTAAAVVLEGVDQVGRLGGLDAVHLLVDARGDGVQVAGGRPRLAVGRESLRDL